MSTQENEPTSNTYQSAGSPAFPRTTSRESLIHKPPALPALVYCLLASIAIMVAAILIVVVVVGATVTAPQVNSLNPNHVPPGHWKEILPQGDQPAARLAHAAATVNDEYMFIHGGFFGFGNQSYADFWKYTEKHDKWTQIVATGDLPPARLHHSLCNINNGKLLLFGGFNYFNTIPTHASYDDLYEYNIGTNAWTKLLPTGPKPTGRGAHDAAFLNGYMYIFGGFPTIGATGHHEEMWRYNPTSNTWENVTHVSTPEGRIGFIFAPVDSTTAVMFGGGCESTGQCRDTWTYNALTQAWTNHTVTGAIPPSRRATHGDVAVFDILYLFGGVSITVVGGSSFVQMFDDFYAYDPSQYRWFLLEPNWGKGPKPPKTFGHTVVRLGSRVVVFGGRITLPTSPGSNQLWEYEVVPPV